MNRWIILEETKTAPFDNKKYYFHYLIYVSSFNFWTCVLEFKLNSPKLVGKKYIKDIIDNFDYYLVNLSKSIDRFNYVLNILNNDPKKFVDKYTYTNNNYKIYNINVSIPQDLCDVVDRKLQQYLSNY